MFPVLSRMAMDILSVQATSVASESAFSTSGRVLSIRRTRLTLASLEMCMCLKDHLDAQDRKQDKSTLETPVDFEEEILDAEVQGWSPRKSSDHAMDILIVQATSVASNPIFNKLEGGWSIRRTRAHSARGLGCRVAKQKESIPTIREENLHLMMPSSEGAPIRYPTGIRAGLGEHLAPMERPDKILNLDGGESEGWFANQ
ncbi:zinc finger BED domain-containing protein RICESLEEPER 2, partial [Tanacetum coccineum]